MIQYVLKPVRTKNGKRVRARTYSGRYKLPGDRKRTQVALGVTDKQVAERKLAQIVRQKERERQGIDTPHACRETLQSPVSEVLQKWLLDLRAKGRKPGYIQTMEQLILRVCKDAQWDCIEDINGAGFQNWRSSNLDKAPKTLNEYLGSFNAFLNWLVRNSLLEKNPLVRVEKVQQEGRETRIRRAISHDDFLTLISTAPADRAIVYACAYYTGLRRGELAQLQWGDLILDSAEPLVQVRASTSKNSKRTSIPLHKDLAAMSAACQLPPVSCHVSCQAISVLTGLSEPDTDFASQ